MATTAMVASGYVRVEYGTHGVAGVARAVPIEGCQPATEDRLMDAARLLE